MTTAKELLLTYMSMIREPDKAASLFAADAAIEIPYLVDVGLPGKFEGHERILQFLRQINTLFPDVAFANVQVFVDSPRFTQIYECGRQRGAEYRCVLVEGL